MKAVGKNITWQKGRREVIPFLFNIKAAGEYIKKGSDLKIWGRKPIF